ncbi:hypothetical protein AA0313_2373 [Acetobacter indonesiensis NRIC 0313]|jgi:hypothetical protein|uniref:DUF2721 domain-containing protein n=1 Tax=Acetobacter indonesiensis TaxID=104101 RepID=A0A6N3T0F7_9PROT|nr:DUF2721 domain-containing protein [Acetobacter indonesiensis]MCI1438439.1 DUF2721 domain-containing protein [Acetobacter indonesiensis]MCI1545479.1 DUF2721 domain-containing protein [Acetobacter indonesiensis]MCI1764784.1 DUF2721 domain-containing protein [Acetobacter indonesiensis]GAN62285.1 hypothetical protein Abin_006_275 [Acetobacter indonesiensis]GBQ60367.1 hypothetical protein AA0313_2373 [Acetobacter indonesiensis NRIC 0313]
MALPIFGGIAAEPVDSVAHIIQIALTPVFMLSGIGTLLNLFNTRLARVSDHIEQANALLLDDNPDMARNQILERHLVRLHRRTLMLDGAILAGGLGGASSCGAAFVLFMGSVRDSSVANWLVLMFGVALACTVGALALFLGDSLISWHGLKREGPLPRPAPKTT